MGSAAIYCGWRCRYNGSSCFDIPWHRNLQWSLPFQGNQFSDQIAYRIAQADIIEFAQPDIIEKFMSNNFQE